ncbi:MAG TPA: hypothetical protein VF292_13645 [Rhodanobacteraceae bacterium]
MLHDSISDPTEIAGRSRTPAPARLHYRACARGNCGNVIFRKPFFAPPKCARATGAVSDGGREFDSRFRASARPTVYH